MTPIPGTPSDFHVLSIVTLLQELQDSLGGGLGNSRGGEDCDGYDDQRASRMERFGESYHRRRLGVVAHGFYY